MSKRWVKVNNVRHCAFCKHWYDINNDYIEPKDPRVNLWYFDDKGECLCMKKNLKRQAWMSCPDYTCKLELR